MSPRNGSGARAWLVAFAATLAVALAGALGAAPAAAQDAERWQQSYDREATGDVAGALAALRGLPERSQGYLFQVRRGWLLYLLGRHTEAVASYRLAIRAQPDAVEPRLGILMPLMAARRWREAEQEARQALRRDRDNHLAMRRMALCLYQLGRFDDAERVYRRVLELHPSDLEMLEGIGWCQLRRGEAAAAAASFREVLAVSPRSAGAAAGLASSAR